MFFSSIFQITTISARPRMPKTTVAINLLLAASLFAVLLPRSVVVPSPLAGPLHSLTVFCSWIFMAERRLRHWDGSDFTMLGAYGTMPMMMNL